MLAQHWIAAALPLIAFTYDFHNGCINSMDMIDVPDDFIFNPNNNSQGLAYRVPLTNAAKNGAVCLDGTVPDIYFRPGFGDGTTKFNIAIQPGGWCMGFTDPIAPPPSRIDTCYHRSMGGMGSSKFNKQYLSIGGEWMSVNSTSNPLFYNWNTVSIRYCDGGSFTSNNQTAYNDPINNYTLYFRGNKILKGALSVLWSDFNMQNATDILIGGCSAGALTTYLHINYIYNTYISTADQNINFLALADSGFFMEYEGIGQFVTGMKWLYEIGNVTTDSVNKQCIKYYNSDMRYKCMFAQNNVAFINKNIKFISLQSRYDAWQLNNEMMNYTNQTANEYGVNLTSYYINNYINQTNFNDNHTGWLDSCFHHCYGWTDMKINGLDQWSLLINWYYDNQTNPNRFYFQNYTYPCDKCCGTN